MRDDRNSIATYINTGIELGKGESAELGNLQMSPTNTGPLKGLKILDMTRILAGPYATQLLGDMGADVIKVERPGAGDDTRGWGPPYVTTADGEATRESAYYMCTNRNKRSIAVDMADPDGADTLRKLAKKADVVIQNFKAGGLAKYGLDYATLSALNPALVYCSISGFGQTGPNAHRAGYDLLVQGSGGIMSLTGEKDGGPVKPGIPVSDLSSGLWIALGIVSMLQGRQKAGTGAYLDFSMLDGQISLLALAAARYFALDEVPERLGTEHPGRVPSASFLCADGGYVHITGADQHWRPLCTLLGLDALGADPRLQHNSGRVLHRDEVMEHLTGAIALLTRAQLCAACDAAGVPAGPLNTLDEVIVDPHLRARGVFADFEHPESGRFPAIQLPFLFNG